MSGFRMIIWFVEVLIWYAVLYFVQLPIRKSEKKGIKFLALFVKMNLLTLAAYLYFVVNSKITYNFAAELTALYMATAGDICGGIIDFVRRTVKKSESSFNPLFLVCVSVAACIFVFIYGVSNSGKTLLWPMKEIYMLSGLGYDYLNTVIKLLFYS